MKALKMNQRLIVRSFLLIGLFAVIVTLIPGCDMFFVKRPAVFSVDPGNKQILIGKQFQYKVSQRDKDGQNTNYPVLYVSLNPAIAAVDDQGTVKAIKQGDVQIKIICNDKSFISRVTVLDGFYSFNYPKEGIFADNGKIQLHETGASGAGTGYVVNYFGDNKGYLQIGLSIKNISQRSILVDPDYFALVGPGKRTEKSANRKLRNVRRVNIMLKKQWFEPGKAVEKLLIFGPRSDFNQAKIVYDDGENPKIIDSLED